MSSVYLTQYLSVLSIHLNKNCLNRYSYKKQENEKQKAARGMPEIRKICHINGPVIAEVLYLSAIQSLINQVTFLKNKAPSTV